MTIFYKKKYYNSSSKNTFPSPALFFVRSIHTYARTQQQIFSLKTFPANVIIQLFLKNRRLNDPYTTNASKKHHALLRHRHFFKCEQDCHRGTMGWLPPRSLVLLFDKTRCHLPKSIRPGLSVQAFCNFVFASQAETHEVDFFSPTNSLFFQELKNVLA